MTKRLASLVLVLLLAGCMYPGQNKDPRVGRVYLDEDACDIFNECSGAWKVCVGPDLVFQQSYWAEAEERWERKVIKQAPECQR